MRVFIDTCPGAAPVSDGCVVPDARKPVGERYTDVPARGPGSTGAAVAVATAAGPPRARRWAGSSGGTGGGGGGRDGRGLRERGVVAAGPLWLPAPELGDE